MRVDDIDRGMFVAVTGCRKTRIHPWTGVEVPAEDFNGVPLEVLEVSLPFVCVTDGAKTMAIDTRVWDLTRVSSRYARAMEARGQVRGPKRRRRREKPDPRLCPRCGERLCQVLGEDRKWRVHCRECRFDGGPVPETR